VSEDLSALLFLILGLFLGAALGVWVGILRGRRAGTERAAQLGNEIAGLNATLGEVRRQLDGREAELTAVRVALDAEKVAAVDAKARLEAERKNLTEQRRQIEELDKRMRDAFQSLSAAALKSSNEQFVILADAKMKPLREQLERYEKQIAELEKARSTAYGGLSQRLESMQQHEERLGRETAALVAALRHSGAKGKWGEIALQRIVELTGMTEHCDFEKQVTVAGETGRLRPDMVVHLPGGRTLVVDSKVNTAAYLDAANATDEAERKRHLEKYAGDVRGTLKALGGKEYWRQFSPTPVLVVMFMPGEAFFAAAISQDWDLIVDGLGMGVLPASPTTLIALLHAVQHGWQQQRAAENAEKIVEAGRELYDRLCTFVKHLEGIRAGIEKTAEAYNEAVGNWERRTLPGVRKLKELGAAEAGKEMVDLTPADVPLRALPPAENSQAHGL
jgi:DNA recombination protein RmuC